MKHFDVIYKIAENNYDIVAAAQARELGIGKTELNRWADIGRLECRGKGVSSSSCIRLQNSTRTLRWWLWSGR